MRIKIILCLVVVLLITTILVMGNVKRYIQANKTDTTDQIRSALYMKDGIKAEYPEFVADGDEERIAKLNAIILKDFNKILQIYAFNPFPEPGPEPVPSAQIPTILNITYDIKLNNPMYTSIYYLAAYNSSFSAHPTNLVYTTNIDKTKNSRIVLGDMIKLDKDFISFFKTWSLADEAGYPDFIRQGIKDYISNINDDELLMRMKKADIIGSGNQMDIYSYLTPDGIGISIGMPNYLGDHAEFEMDYNALKPYLNPAFSLSS